MKLKKFSPIIFLILINISIASAAIEITKKPFEDVIIPELKNPATFELTIKNLGENDVFEVYSLVGVDIDSGGNISLASGEEKTLLIKLMPNDQILKSEEIFNFVYKLRGEKSGITEDSLIIKIVKLNSTLEVGAYNINPESDKATIYIKNKVNYNFPEIKTRFYSSFFDFDETFSLASFEKKEFSTELDQEEIKKLIAGSYIINADFIVNNIQRKIENTFKFTEKSNIATQESKEGFIIVKKTIEKTNEGNLPSLVNIEVQKNIISRLFTTFNIEPLKVERTGFSVTYNFQKELKPSESFAVKITTNWLYPLFLVIVVLITGVLVSIYTSTFLIVNKKSTYVRTKGGEFALKITLRVKSKKFLERVSLIDKLPSMFTLHNRFGSIEPTKIDEKNKRLEWTISVLQAGEERVFSYIIYSKLGVAGKFELPLATAIYEKDGKIHETQSNRVYFLSDIRKKVE